MTRWLTVVLLVLTTGLAMAAPVPKALKKAKPESTRVSLSTAAERVERHTRLMFLSKLPARDIELEWPWPSGEKPPLEELFATLNEQLEPQGLVLRRRAQSFTVEPVAK